jgi:serpin B
VGGINALANSQPPAGLKPDTTALVKGDNTFACDLYHKLSEKDGNLFFSPYSISNALAMTYAGARGQTALDMAKTLQFPFEGQQLHSAWADLIQELNRPGQKRAYQLSIANRLWGQKGYGFLPEFLKLSRDAYGAGLEEVDFIKATEQARQTINDWVAKETQDKITDLIEKKVVTQNTRLVLTNAIYFKASWADAFNKRATMKEDFKSRAGKTTNVDMMHQNERLKLLETDTFQLLELPYRQQELSMLVLLPRQSDGLAALEQQLSADQLSQSVGKMQMRQVNVSMPKYKFTAKFMLKQALTEMGMGNAFSPAADFSGITHAKGLFISAVVHQAFVAVDEHGTEAAAATAVVLGDSLPRPLPPATFRADHPFMFLIRDNRTGSILFMGRVVNP